MLLLGVKEKYQERLKRSLEENGLSVALWYECSGDEEILIVPSDFIQEDGILLEVESCEDF